MQLATSSIGSTSNNPIRLDLYTEHGNHVPVNHRVVTNLVSPETVQEMLCEYQQEAREMQYIDLTEYELVQVQNTINDQDPYGHDDDLSSIADIDELAQASFDHYLDSFDVNVELFDKVDDEIYLRRRT